MSDTQLSMALYSLYQIDAFTDQLFSGNPAAVVPLKNFLPVDTMLAIAQENNLSETAFIVPRSDGSYDLRWFTPAAEIEFCGHATIASAHALFTELGACSPLVFHTEIGVLKVGVSDNGYTLYAPNFAAKEIPITHDIIDAFGPGIISAHLAANNIYIELKDAQTIYSYQPDIPAISTLLRAIAAEGKTRAHLGASIMAAGDGEFARFDFVSRHFAPLHDVDEDPVTGSAHSVLAPYWAKRLGKTKMTACQCSARGGILHLDVRDDSVLITGKAVTYLRGEITLD